MGPRFFDRGNGAAREKPDVNIHVLQWGRGSLTAETLAELLPQMVQIPASMGPRFFDRGNVARDDGTSCSWGASMGPRFFDRGNVT